ncbi:DUF922 domain-containing protein [Mesorhizobium sp. Mes31]|uniref:DUF922 domain-containing protein n=1 Tax=Mesorhizobium sp. Mes31 TaxID=2926017 RepID=UPI0021196165|nr:DUF922 domain-containing protein [Mesorhizobium sp. Mes31]
MKSKLLNRSMSGYAVVFTGLAFIVGVGAARADVKLEVTNTTYELRGLSLHAIDVDLHRVAEKDSDGIIEGELKDDFNWTFKFVETADACRVTSDDIMLKLNMLLPRWADEEHADPALRTAWKAYIDDLKAHEDGHKTIAVDAAEKISRLTHGATALGSCDALKRSLNSAASQIVEAAEKAQEQLDAKDEPVALE